MSSPKRIQFQNALDTLTEILSEHKLAKESGGRGERLERMADRIRERARIDPTSSRGETIDDLQSSPCED